MCPIRYRPEDHVHMGVLLCNNQKRILDEQVHPMTWENCVRLSSIGRVVALLDTWEDPVYFTRIWTMFEQYCAVKRSIPVHIIPPPGAAGPSTSVCNLRDVKQSLTRIDAAKAKASVPIDEQKLDIGSGRESGSPP